MKRKVNRLLGEMRTVSWWWHRTVEMVVALTVVYVFTGALEQRNERLLNQVEPTEWMEIEELYVPDHSVGSNPILVFDKRVKTPFLGFWIAEVQLRDIEPNLGFRSACTGIGEEGYTPEPGVPEREVRWSDFLGKDCSVPPGVYRIVYTVDMRVPGYPVKRLRALSNVFEVNP